MQGALIACVAVGLGVSLLEPPYPRDQLLQHIPTVVGLAGLAVCARRGVFSDLSMGAMLVFAALHIVGARWRYSNVPYDAWWHALTGETLTARFDLARNHYDRLVHLAFGVLCVFPLDEWIRGRGARRVASAALVVLLVLAIGALYEIFEWGLSFTVSPSVADGYAGQQGDVWDAPKDMALALVGALGALPLSLVRRKSP